MDGGFNRRDRAVIHIHNDTAYRLFVALMRQREGALLGNLIFHMTDLAVDSQLMGVGIIVHHTYTSNLQHIVDIANIARYLLIGLGQLLQVSLSL